jgi:hypothetical protein
VRYPVPVIGKDLAERQARAEQRRNTWRGGVAKLAHMDAIDDEFLVIGGYAVGFHDRPRATKC